MKDIIKRIEKLEKAVFGKMENSKGKNKKPKKEDSFSGPTGGLRFLISKNYFTKKRSLAEVKKEMEKNSYIYSDQAVQMALGRNSKVGGPLVSLKDGGKKAYVERK